MESLIIHSPGRINLIGEHTDYNEGYVLPAAIDKKILLKFRKIQNSTNIHVKSIDFNEEFIFNLNRIKKSETEWQNYLLGVVNELLNITNKLEGFYCEIKSDLPVGSGLSSSAALECGFAFGLNVLFDLNLSKLEIIKLAQRAEHDFVGTQCGIMDQFSSVMGEADNLLLLDCRSMEYKKTPLHLGPYKMVLLNTKVTHNLSTSGYNDRKEECYKGVQLIQKYYPEIKSLRDIGISTLKSLKEQLPEKVYKRCLFVVEENQRVLDTTKAIKMNDLQKVGRLLYAAHDGLRDLYEVSCPESDFLVDFGKSNKNILGSRQIGGGFGGCVLSIILENDFQAYIEKVQSAYFDKFKIKSEVYVVSASNGTSMQWEASEI